jgi:hypothetical protein
VDLHHLLFAGFYRRTEGLDLESGFDGQTFSRQARRI